MLPTTSLIEKAKQGHEVAREQLFTLILKEHVGPWTRRYRNRNILVDEADIESEFTYGCLRALESVDITRGNPLLYLLWKGNMQVAHLLRTRIKKGVIAECRACGAVRKVQVRRGHSECRGCGSTDLVTYMVSSSAEDLVKKGRGDDTPSWDSLTSDIDAASVWSAMVYGVQVDEMRRRLRGRVLELFDLLVVEGINRESSQNYIKEIATRWGVTTAAVSVYLRKLRAAVTAYIEEE